MRTIVSESSVEIAPRARFAAGSEAFSEFTGALCQHCGRHPFAVPDEDAVRAADDDEAWLWQVIDDGDRTREAAPVAPTPEDVASARRALASATAAHRRVEIQVEAIEIALSKPSTWLRPRHRIALARALRRGRAAAIAAASTRDQAARAFAEMNRRAAQRRSYMATHRPLLASAADARRELDRRIDQEIDAHTKAPEPPAWFRFGLGYPPRSEAYGEWLARARKAIGYRRRHGIDHPLEPTGGVPVD
jgi:hypothetical protein